MSHSMFLLVITLPDTFFDSVHRALERQASLLAAPVAAALAQPGRRSVPRYRLDPRKPKPSSD